MLYPSSALDAIEKAIGRVERATYDATGAAKPFISGYAQPASVFA